MSLAASLPDAGGWSRRGTENDSDLDTDPAAAIGVLRGRAWAVLTGAGISTDSGIPDYRGPTSIRATPMQYGEFVSSAEAQRRYWARSFLGWRRIGQARPNDGHKALVRAGGRRTDRRDHPERRRPARCCRQFHGDQPARRDRGSGLPRLRRPRVAASRSRSTGWAQSRSRRTADAGARRAPAGRRRRGPRVARLRPGSVPHLRRQAQARRGVLRRAGAQGTGRERLPAGRRR